MRTLVIGLVMLAAACGDGATPRSPAGDPGRGAAAGPEVKVWFTRVDQPVAVTREVEAAQPREALAALLRGPSPDERARGLGSWFSDSTAGALREVELRDGLLVVNFRDLDRIIPNASSSFGSTLLLMALDSTVFQFPEVDSVEYRLNGSCHAFGEWLQRGCEGVRRP